VYVRSASGNAIVVNGVAKSVIDSVRGGHDDYVFTYRGLPISVMNNSAWKRARREAGLPQVRVHDLKHTFGRRLRAAGVSFEDRQDLLGHRSGRITTHYSEAELQCLIDAANQVVGEKSRKSPALMLLKQNVTNQTSVTI
jgi:integrase